MAKYGIDKKDGDPFTYVGQYGEQYNEKKERDSGYVSPIKGAGMGWDYFGGSGSSYFKKNSNLGKWFKDYAATQGISGNILDFISSLTDEQLGSLLNSFWYKSRDLGFSTDYDFDTEDALAQLKKLSEIDMPMERSYQDIWDEAAANIDAENAKAAALYDQALSYQKNIYNSQLQNINNGYNNLARQTLAMDYQKNNQLLGSLEGSMSKARQNALEAGASAGIRLANNVNTLMSTQNQQAQQSLQTSNNLAQMLMNQQQAAAGLQGNLANAYSNNANQKAGLVKGDFERKQASANTAWNTYQNSYQNRLDAATAALGDNQFVDSFKNYQQTQNYKKQTQSSPTGNGAY